MLLNSTVANNSSTCSTGGCVGGGGIVSHSSRTTITQSTLAYNYTDVYYYLGGNVISFYAPTTVRNSILAGSGQNCRSFVPSEIVSAGHNLSDDASCAASLAQPGDMNGVPAGLTMRGLQNAGGSTPTIALVATSAAVDAIAADACGSGDAATDQRGVPRPQAAACDIGAFELILAAAALDLAPPSSSSFVTGWTGPITLAATLTRADGASPVAGALVTFVVDGSAAGASTTDGAGIATLSFDPSALAPGSHTVKASSARQTIDDDSFEAVVSASRPLTVERQPYAAQVQAPIRPDGASVFTLKRGVVPVKFALTYDGTGTCALPPATLSLVRMFVTPAGPVNEQEYVMPADAGTSFRVDTSACHYVYNLASDTLGPGEYLVRISIGPTIVGTGRFGIQ
jgi:hypothetical protein